MTCEAVWQVRAGNPRTIIVGCAREAGPVFNRPSARANYTPQCSPQAGGVEVAVRGVLFVLSGNAELHAACATMPSQSQCQPAPLANHRTGALCCVVVAKERALQGWVQLEQGHGVRATRVNTVDELADAFARALVVSGPSLIEAMLC